MGKLWFRESLSRCQSGSCAAAIGNLLTSLLATKLHCSAPVVAESPSHGKCCSAIAKQYFWDASLESGDWWYPLASQSAGYCCLQWCSVSTQRMLFCRKRWIFFHYLLLDTKTEMESAPRAAVSCATPSAWQPAHLLYRCTIHYTHYFNICGILHLLLCIHTYVYTRICLKEVEKCSG